MCKDRLLSECPGEWEPGCDLGNNEKFVRVGRPTDHEQLASIEKTKRGPRDEA